MPTARITPLPFFIHSFALRSLLPLASPAALSSRYSSFLRSLSYYSFTKNPENPCAEYQHPSFLMGKPDSITKVRTSTCNR